MKTFPIFFQNVTCMRGHQARTDAPFFVRRNDRIIVERATALKAPEPLDQNGNASQQKAGISGGEKMVVVKSTLLPAGPGVVDPNTGLPSVPGGARSFDPATGLPVASGTVPVPSAQNSGAKSADAGNASASAETWSPNLAPDEKLDFQKILSTAQSLTDEGSYEDALQHYLWYFDHSRSDGGQRGVRLSFALSDWIELGRRYPKAKQALIEIRDADTSQFSKGGYADLFQEVSGINKYLSQEDATLALFKTIEQRDPALAGQCYPWVQDLLVQKGEYEKCLRYIGDPQGAFERIRDSRERMKSWEDQQADRREKMQKRFQVMAKTNSAFLIPPAIPAPPKFADNNFVGQTRQLIEILVGAGRKADAEKIRDQALAVVDDDRLKAAVTDAEAKVKQP
jgi:hypothetical protein